MRAVAGGPTGDARSPTAERFHAARTNVLSFAAMRLWLHGDPIGPTADSDGRPLTFLKQGESRIMSMIKYLRKLKKDWWSITGEVRRVYDLVASSQVLTRGLRA